GDLAAAAGGGGGLRGRLGPGAGRGPGGGGGAVAAGAAVGAAGGAGRAGGGGGGARGAGGGTNRGGGGGGGRGGGIAAVWGPGPADLRAAGGPARRRCVDTYGLTPEVTRAWTFERRCDARGASASPEVRVVLDPQPERGQRVVEAAEVLDEELEHVGRLDGF